MTTSLAVLMMFAVVCGGYIVVNIIIGICKVDVEPNHEVIGENMDNEKQTEYTKKLVRAIEKVFEEDSENYIDIDELQEGENANHFTHALGSLAPFIIFKNLVGEEESPNDVLGFNHLTNRLCVQYAELTHGEKNARTHIRKKGG